MEALTRPQGQQKLQRKFCEDPTTGTAGAVPGGAHVCGCVIGSRHWALHKSRPVSSSYEQGLRLELFHPSTRRHFVPLRRIQRATANVRQRLVRTWGLLSGLGLQKVFLLSWRHADMPLGVQKPAPEVHDERGPQIRRKGGVLDSFEHHRLIHLEALPPRNGYHLCGDGAR